MCVESLYIVHCKSCVHIEHLVHIVHCTHGLRTVQTFFGGGGQEGPASSGLINIQVITNISLCKQ
jgi:hypothetical protein